MVFHVVNPQQPPLCCPVSNDQRLSKNKYSGGACNGLPDREGERDLKDDVGTTEEGNFLQKVFGCI